VRLYKAFDSNDRSIRSRASCPHLSRASYANPDENLLFFVSTPLRILTSITPTGDPLIEDASVIEDLPEAQGAIIPTGGTVVGITIPIIRSDQTGLRYQTRNHDSEFMFNTGTLHLTLLQEIHMSDGLSMCARTIWLQHEHLTSDAAARQDTQQEYQSVDRQVRLRCGQTLRPLVRRGEYGDGIDLVQLALNRQFSVPPPLKIDGIFGPIMEQRVKDFQRSRHLSDDGVVGPDTRTALGL